MNPARFARFALVFMFAAAVSPAHGATPLDSLIQRTTLSVEVGDKGLAGPGAEWILAHAGASRHVLLAEHHGVARMARFARGLSASLAGIGYQYTAIEVDPLVTADLERLMRSHDPDALKKYLQQDGYALAVPFYLWAEEAEFLREAVRNGPKNGPALWAMDQAFIGAAPVWFDRIETLARSPAAKKEAARMGAAARADIYKFLGSVDESELEGLRRLLAADDDAEARKLVDALIQSARIYRPFVVREGSVYAANLERETLMKHLLVEQSRAAEQRDGAPPRALFKFGQTHMTRGLSATHVPSLANFVYETLQAEGSGALSIMMVCAPGAAATDFVGNVTGCEESFAEAFGFLAGHIEQPGYTLVDLGPWKDSPRLWKNIPAATANLIWAFDAMLVVSGGGGSHAILER
jgi:hypothetical protein